MAESGSPRPLSYHRSRARTRKCVGATYESQLCPASRENRGQRRTACSRAGARPFHSAAATKARQPPYAEMSRAPLTASASTRKPFTTRPSASLREPIDRGGGTAATKRPKAVRRKRPINFSVATCEPALGQEPILRPREHI